VGLRCEGGVAAGGHCGLSGEGAPTRDRSHHDARRRVLISALSFDLMSETYRTGGFDSTAAGFLGGAALYTGANWLLARQAARHRKRSGDQQPSENQNPGSGMALFVGALIDGIPESIAI
jgi:ZIP family zinc transporter